LITNFNNSSKLGDSFEKYCGVQLENKDGMLRLIEKLEKNRENMPEIILVFCDGKGDDETKELIITELNELKIKYYKLSAEAMTKTENVSEAVKQDKPELERKIMTVCSVC
jgi:hypothetical protein